MPCAPTGYSAPVLSQHCNTITSTGFQRKSLKNIMWQPKKDITCQYLVQTKVNAGAAELTHTFSFLLF